ncbi:MAG: SH3 domain-containing protein [Lachnospiraceae bacterium]|nr:SH3 domain-containing protein [Lachnospiraceae bacterium]
MRQKILAAILAISISLQPCISCIHTSASTLPDTYEQKGTLTSLHTSTNSTGSAVSDSSSDNDFSDNNEENSSTPNNTPDVTLFSEKSSASSLKRSAKGSSPFTSSTYTHDDAFDDMNIYHGVDVSYYNGTIDWTKAKKAGVQYAIIRVGYRGYGAAGTLCTDTQFLNNIKGAQKAGVKIGVYYFTEAINEKEAIEEAEYCINKISDYDVTLPVAIDYEFPTSGGKPVGRMYNAKLSKKAATKNVTAFCKTIKNAGYTPMVYANKSDLATLIDGAALSKNYKIWLANYTTNTTYSGKYEFWQYTSSGKVNGITGNSGRVDCNFWYTKTKLEDLTTSPKPTVTPTPTVKPTPTPTVKPTTKPTAKPTVKPTTKPTAKPTPTPTAKPTTKPTAKPTVKPTTKPTAKPTPTPTAKPTTKPTAKPTPTVKPTPNTKPAAPSSFTTTSSSKSITLKWKAAKNVSGYQIYRKTTYNGTYKKLKTISDPSTVTYNNTGLGTDHEYYYRIRSYSKVGSKTYYSSYKALSAATLSHGQAAIAQSNIKLLKKPSLSAGVVKTVPKNATVKYLGRTFLKNNSKFLHIEYVVSGKSYKGYMTTSAKFKYYKPGTTTANLNLRKAAGTDKDKLTLIPKGTPIAILSKTTVNKVVWYKTQYLYKSKLYKGYVASTYVK